MSGEVHTNTIPSTDPQVEDNPREHFTSAVEIVLSTLVSQMAPSASAIIGVLGPQVGGVGDYPCAKDNELLSRGTDSLANPTENPSCSATEQEVRDFFLEEASV